MLRKRNAYTVFLLMEGATSLFFALIFTVNMVYQVTVVHLNPLQLVLVGTLLETVVFIFEVPTGIVADVYSRRLSIIIGLLLIGLGFTMEVCSPTLGLFCCHSFSGDWARHSPVARLKPGSRMKSEKNAPGKLSCAARRSGSSAV